MRKDDNTIFYNFMAAMAVLLVAILLGRGIREQNMEPEKPRVVIKETGRVGTIVCGGYQGNEYREVALVKMDDNGKNELYNVWEYVPVSQKPKK